MLTIAGGIILAGLGWIAISIAAGVIVGFFKFIGYVFSYESPSRREENYRKAQKEWDESEFGKASRKSSHLDSDSRTVHI